MSSRTALLLLALLGAGCLDSTPLHTITQPPLPAGHTALSGKVRDACTGEAIDGVVVSTIRAEAPARATWMPSTDDGVPWAKTLGGHYEIPDVAQGAG